jgi:Secretion system C-terminal sorting domain
VSDVAIIRYESPKSYAVFPNPASDYVEIDLLEAPQGKEVEIAIVSLLGKVVYQTKIEALGSKNHQIALDNLENGQYFVRIQAQGKKLVMKKLVVVK